MGWTKRDFVLQAFEELGLAPSLYDLTPEQLNSAVKKMDAMIAGWNANGVRINYPLPSSPNNTNLDDDSGVPDFALEAIYLNLALRLAPSYGKTVPQETKVAADMSYSSMVNQALQPTPERQLPQTMPRGQGTKPWRNFNNPYLNRPEDPIDAGSDSTLTFE
jgi:hypothetical protein